VRDITYKNITVTGRRIPKSRFQGLDAQHTVRGITIDNLRFNGKPAQTAVEAGLALGTNVSDVRFGKSGQ
jgi:hypothetical protein